MHFVGKELCLISYARSNMYAFDKENNANLWRDLIFFQRVGLVWMHFVANIV